jgi:hypothetical protein
LLTSQGSSVYLPSHWSPATSFQSMRLCDSIGCHITLATWYALVLAAFIPLPRPKPAV